MFRALPKRLQTALVLLAMLVVSSISPALAQTDIPMLILPIDRATFLPGAYFDIRVEMHTEAMPDDATVTINGEDMSEFFGVGAAIESWEFGDEAEPTPSQSMVWRQVTAPAPGTYVVEVSAAGQTKAVTWTVHEPQDYGASNIILFVADGMQVPMVTAARLVSRGNTEGKYNGYLTIDQMEEFGLVSTSGMDSIITDSANSASAYNTGHKSAVNAIGVYPDTSPDTLDDPRVENFAELVKRSRGMSVGIVSTANWTDATPAAVYGHTRRRADLNYLAASPLDEGLMPEVIMGGGARQMIPEEVAGGRRDDGRNLFDEYEAAGYTVVTTAAELAALDETPSHLLGLFSSNHMNVWLDRNVYTDNIDEGTDQPGLVEMTLTALDVLGQNPNGFYLEVEAASVDKQAHPLDQERMLADLIEFDNAIAAALAWAAENAPDTLIVVTADHGHGYEVYGTVDVQAFNAAEDDAGKRDAIGIYAAAGFPTYQDNDGDFFPDTWDVDVTLAGTFNNHPDHTENFQVSEVPRVPAVNQDGVLVNNPDDDPNGIPMNGNLPMNAGSGVHTLQDVPIYASGPGASFFNGIIDNTEIFFGMAFAIGLDPSAETGVVDCAGIMFAGNCYVR